MGHAARSIEAFAMRRLRSALWRSAVDITGQTSLRSSLVLAPHPDDETLGCGATIARKTSAGRQVHVVVCTDGRNSHRSAMIPPKDLAQIREVEATDACQVLGVSRENVMFLRYEDGHLRHRMEDLFHELADAITACKPDELISPSPIDRHPDHRAVAAVVDELIRRGVVSCPVIEYPVWFWTARAWSSESDGSPFSALPTLMRPGRTASALRPMSVSTDGFLLRKREALSKHKSQVTNLTGEAGWATLDAAFLDHFFQPRELFFAHRSAEQGRVAG